MRALVLRLDAPLMSFGTVMVDRHGYIDRFPGTAMLTGLIANALGWHHGDVDRLQSLQQRIQYAARWDVRPQRLVDYHTVDLGLAAMRRPGWTTRGVPEHRSGGDAAKYGTHERFRHYWCDGLLTVVLTLRGYGEPDLDQVAEAIRRPARPLFLGRKSCLPTRPLLDPETPVVEGQSLRSMLQQVTLWNRDGSSAAWDEPRIACWPADEGRDGLGELRRVYDLRDWSNQISAGSRWRMEGLVGEEQL